jgi:ADP-heptose:LPS heptosyltransferase
MSNKRRIKVKKIPMKVSKGTVIERFMTDEGRKLSENSDIADRNPEDALMAIRFGDSHVHVVYPEDEVLCQQMVEKILYELDLEIEEDENDLIVGKQIPDMPPGKFEQIPNFNLVSDIIKPEKKELPKRIVFHNRQAIGDILMFTCAIRDFKKVFPNVQVQVDSTVGHIWDHNPNINRESWPLLIDPMMFDEWGEKPSDGKKLELNKQAVLEAVQQDKPVKLYIGPGKATNASNRSDNHFANAYRISMENVLGVSIPQGPIRADIYMTEEEYNRPPIIEGPYWLITAGEKGDWTCKTFAFEKWREVVEKNPLMTFVQIGEKKHKHPDLDFPNVINYIGKTEDRHTGIRDLFNLFNYCEGSMGLVSFQMHLAAAFNKPCITIAGAREPVWFTRYPGQQYLASDGCLPCTVSKRDEPTSCWFCDIKRCPHQSEYEGQKVPLCADLFTSDDVLFAIKRYYKGGRLKEGKVSGKSKLVNIVKEQPKVVLDLKEVDSYGQLKFKEEKEIDPEDHSTWGFTFGGSSITDKDWEFIAAVLKEEKVKRVLEIGSGYSTLLMRSIGIEVVSFETKQGDIDRLKKINPNVDVRLWDGLLIDIFNQSMKSIRDSFDLVFVDGPGGGENRGPSFDIASKITNKILIHDAGRAPEKKWIEKHLFPKFQKVAQGGHRTAFFKLTKEVKKEKAVLEHSRKDKPKIKVVFNGRGEGGAERSTTWIMNEFIRKGWAVDYITPSRVSGTFQKEGSKEVLCTTDLSKIKEPCDILFLYCNDWIFGFKGLNGEFDNVQAKRKVMTVNYRLGDVGFQSRAPWTLGWDKYLFLNSSKEKTFRERVVIGANTKAMAPPTDLTEYFDIQPNYNGNLRIVRHSSQEDVKYPKDFSGKVRKILDEIPNSEIFLMPAPSFLSPMPEYTGRVHCHQKNVPPVKEFLAQGNVFWYHLPEGYEDQGPKVIMEAQSCGLAVVADNHSGAKDRVVKRTGLLCDTFDEHLEALKMYAERCDRLKHEGEEARHHAKKEYDPQNWIKEIIGERKDTGEERITEALKHFKQRANGYKELEEQLISERK